MNTAKKRKRGASPGEAGSHGALGVGCGSSIVSLRLEHVCGQTSEAPPGLRGRALERKPTTRGGTGAGAGAGAGSGSVVLSGGDHCSECDNGKCDDDSSGVEYSSDSDDSIDCLSKDEFDDDSEYSWHWSSKRVERWFAEHEGGKYKRSHASFLGLDGEQLGLMTEGDFVRRCGKGAGRSLFKAWRPTVPMGEHAPPCQKSKLASN